MDLKQLIRNITDLFDVEFDIGTPTEGQVLTYNSVSSKWKAEDRSAIGTNNKEIFNGDDVTSSYTLSNTPLNNTLQLFWNGLLQEEGIGKDYTISGKVITFSSTPVLGDTLIIYYRS